MNSVEVAVAGVEPPSWAQRCAGFAKKVLRARGIRNWELSILLCDDATIRELNRRYRRLDEPTDVLAFSQLEGARPAVPKSSQEGSAAAQGVAGDVVVSLETMRRNAGGEGIPEEEELKRLLIHGILHLEGMDHPDDTAEMLAIQEGILALLSKERLC